MFELNTHNGQGLGTAYLWVVGSEWLTSVLIQAVQVLRTVGRYVRVTKDLLDLTNAAGHLN